MAYKEGWGRGEIRACHARGGLSLQSLLLDPQAASGGEPTGAPKATWILRALHTWPAKSKHVSSSLYIKRQLHVHS